MTRHPLYAWATATGRTVNQMCSDLGISRAALHNWDNGYQMPCPRTLSRILEATNGAVTPNDCHRHWESRQA